MRLRPSRLAPLCLALGGLVFGGCDDEREPTAGPSSGFFDGDTVFGTALVSASIYRYQNAMAERALNIVVNNLGTPIVELGSGCTGSGDLTITRDPLNASRLTFKYESDLNGAFVIDCNSDLRINVSGEMTFEFLDTTPGAIHYLIEMPFNLATATPEGMTYQLPSDVGGGAILLATTPGASFDPSVDPYGFGGFLDCVQNGSRIEQTGTLRLEERQQTLLIIEEMETSYTYDSTTSPSFGVWPAGRFQIAALAIQGFGIPSSTVPFEVTFDGFGGATFPLGARTCLTNMATGENPCQDL